MVEKQRQFLKILMLLRPVTELTRSTRDEEVSSASSSSSPDVSVDNSRNSLTSRYCSAKPCRGFSARHFMDGTTKEQLDMRLGSC